MSRWDALRPNSRERQKWHDERQKPRQKDDAVERFLKLRDSTDGGQNSPQRLVELATITKHHAASLPHPEQTAKIVVKDLFLMALRDKNNGGDPGTQSTVLEALGSLLRDNPHASAILASLTEHVSSTGIERTVRNPVRKLLFDTLQQLLLRSETTNPGDVCTCLTTALQTTQKIDSLADLDLRAMESYFRTSLMQSQNSSVRRKQLRLLLAVLQRHGQFSTTLFKVLLLREQSEIISRGPICKRCGVKMGGLPPFLAGLHESHDTTTVECLAVLLSNLPLELWLPKSENVRRPGFPSHVVQAILDILRIAKCSRSTDASFCGLVKAILSFVPYRKEFEEFTFELVKRLTRSALDLDVIVPKNTLIECIGGKVTPQGHLTKMNVMLRLWLQSGDGQSFCDTLVEGCLELPNAGSILAALLRVDSELLLDNKVRWASFVSAMNHDLERMAPLIESLIVGRKKSCSSSNKSCLFSEKELVVVVLPRLETLIQSTKVQCKQVACSAFGHLQTADWAEIPDQDRYLGLIISLVSNESNASQVKSSGWKAIGLICEHNFGGISASNMVFNTILAAILQADGAASVQCMVWFAFGNLMKALSDCDSLFEGINGSLFAKVVIRAEDLASGSNEKVATNAFRATGFASCVLLRNEYHQQLEAVDFISSAFISRTVSSCVSRIKALVLLSSSEAPQLLTWKQRSGVKKLGRVACSVLCYLFSSDSARSCDHAQDWQQSILCLMNCIDLASKLDEKFLASAFCALRSLDAGSYTQALDEKLCYVGKAILSCCEQLFFTTSCSPRTRHELDRLLAHLLGCASTPDAILIVNSPQLSREDGLIRLHKWMVEQNCSSGSFGTIALAMRSRIDPSWDVLVEQEFSNRALDQESLAVVDNDEL